MSSSVSRPLFVLALCAVSMFSTGCAEPGDSLSPGDQQDASDPRPAVGRFATLSLNTESSVPIISRVDYVAGSYALVSADSLPLAQGTLEIKGRGNSTWAMPKKPYRLKLTTSTSMLGMPANRHWVLLANYADKTLMRNDLTFELSRQLDMAYTPRADWVHLQLNGQYEGLYQLVEHVRIGSERIDIPELNVADTTAALITGGYLLEIDETAGEAFCFNGPRTASMVFCAQNPEALHEARWSKHRAYITGYIAQLEEALFGPQFADPTVGYAAYLDVASVVDYFLINEVLRNFDGDLRRSTFLTKPRGGKLAFGPVWDFDLAIGNAELGGADKPDGWHIRLAPWYVRLFEDPAFSARVRERWRQLKSDGSLTRLQQLVDTRATYLSVEQRRNFQRWPILDVWVWPNRIVTGSYEGEVAAMKSWLSSRVAWMDAEFSR
jgi:CotH kinase protein